MKPGDLVEYRWPTLFNKGKVFLVLETGEHWIKLLGRHGLKSPAKFVIVSESR